MSLIENKDPKIKILINALQKPSGWYTGREIKKYLKKEVFALDKDFSNPAMKAGRWSAYAHYDQLVAFKNLLDKEHIHGGKTVLVHPLLPANLVQELFDRKVNVLSLDITKQDLNFPTDNFKKFVENILAQKQNLDGVIYYSFTGLCKELISQILFAKAKTIPSLLVVDNPNVNPILFDVFSSLTLGSVLWKYGESFWDLELKNTVSGEVSSSQWYLSWHIENRTRSTLEHHLSDSQEVFEPLIQAYTYLLINNFAAKSWYWKLYKIYFSRFVIRGKILNQTQAESKLLDLLPKTKTLAVPDVIFELPLESEKKLYKNHSDLIHKASDLQLKTKSFYSFFSKSVADRPAGSLEVPNLFLEKTYLVYFFYSTEKSFWIQDLNSRNIKVISLPAMHPAFVSAPTLNIANFVSNFMLACDLV